LGAAADPLGAASAAGSKPLLVARPPLDVYKKLAIVRKSSDAVVYLDADGVLNEVADLTGASTSTVSTSRQLG
jgi:hypothetical protein